MRRYLLFFLIGTASAALAAPPVPVHWRVMSAPHDAVKPGAKFEVTVAGAIDPGWHVYALQEPQGGPIATQVGIAENDPAETLRVTSSKPHIAPDASFGMPTGVFENTVDFTLHLRATPESGSGSGLQVLIRYQACNNQVCLPPHTDTVPVPLAISR